MFLPLSHTSNWPIFPREHVQRIFFFTFHVHNCLLACLTCHVDTRHTELHSHIFLMSLCYYAASNCSVGKRTITLKKGMNHPASQSVSQSAFPSHPAVTLATWAYRLLCVRGEKSWAWSQTLVILAKMTSIYQIEALHETSYPVSKRNY